MASLAEQENWSFEHERAGEDEPHPILHSYIVYTFAKLKKQAEAGDPTLAEKMEDGRRYACFDTAWGAQTRPPRRIRSICRKIE